MCAITQPLLQAQAQREAFRHQTSKKLLLRSNRTSADGGSTAAEHADDDGDAADAAADAAERLTADDYGDLAALAGRLAAQQEEIELLSSQLNAANAKRAELAKVRWGEVVSSAA